LFASGLFGLNTAIGNEEAKGILDSTYNVVGNVNQLIMNTISSSDYDPKLMIFKALVFIVPMIFMWLILIVYDRFYKLDEVEYSRIIKVIEERKTKEVKE
jgi:Na+/melibiose symporter-like transporter